MTTHFNNLKNHSQAISIVEYHGIENFWKKGKKQSEYKSFWWEMYNNWKIYKIEHHKKGKPNLHLLFWNKN